MTPAEADCRCYAVRRLNPFEGVLQVVESGRARAYSSDGRQWQVQVLTRRPEHTWRSASDAGAVEQFFNFGLWNAEIGLHRVRANPVMDIGAMQAAADGLAAQLRRVVERLPFVLVDCFERWSVDDDGRPVALLAATERRDRVAGIRVDRWRALAASSRVERGETGPRAHAECLEALVGCRGRAVTWYERLQDGSGAPIVTGVATADAGRAAAVLPAEAFPELGLTQAWDDADARALVDEYLAWQAPRLLMLQRVGRERRAWLEHHACRQATELAAGYRLFPEVVDGARLDAARVEARLRRAG